MPKNNGKSLLLNRTLYWTKPSLSKRAIRSRKTGYFESGAEHTPRGLYGNPKTPLLSTKNIRQNKKPIIYQGDMRCGEYKKVY